jgi:hypothetical protein
MKIKTYNDFYNWTKKNDLDYEFDTCNNFNDTINVFDKDDNWTSVPYPAGKKGSWNETKNKIKKELL